jgi:hypothetical protein
MTSVRQSIVFALEDKFRDGNKDGSKWYCPPPGTYFSSTSSRQASPIYSTGSKKWDAAAYGAFSGTWDWTFIMDYNYLEPFALAFDTYEKGSITRGNQVCMKYTFSKENGKRPPSFAIRRKIMHRSVGGEKDETVILKGCVVNSISFARSASSSQYQVTMSGIYADEEMTNEDLTSTDYKKHVGNLVEYSCLSIGGEGLLSSEIVANTDSVTIGISNNVSLINNTCTPFAKAYHDDRTAFQVSTSCYSTDPRTYKKRVYSGGKNNTADKPWSKGLLPLDKMYLSSFSYDPRTVAAGEAPLKELQEMYDASDHSVLFTISNVVLRSMKWVNGDGSKLTDSLSSVDCQDISLEIVRKESEQGSNVWKNVLS